MSQSIQTQSTGTSVATLPTRELAVAKREETAIAGYMAPALWEEAKPVISHLFGLPMKNGTNDEEEIGFYRMACAGEPLWAIKQVVAGFRIGKLGNGFCPNSAQFGTALREATSAEREKWLRARRATRDAEALAEMSAPPGPMSGETRKLVAEMTARMQARSAEFRPGPLAPVRGGPSPAARVAADTEAKRAGREAGR